MTNWRHRLRSGGVAPRPSAPPERVPALSGHEDRCVGSLLGCACGDILGANLEFKSHSEIRRQCGRVDRFLDSDWRPFGTYNDDTEMTLALATSLVECGDLDPGDCASSLARFFAAEPRRGYGPAVSQILSMLCSGADYRSTGRVIYPEGSFANGGAMRIAPVGLAFRNAPAQELREAVRLALLCTHVHPDAVDGAFVQAQAVALLANTEDARTWTFARVLPDLQAAAQGRVLKSKLAIVGQALAESWDDEALLSAVCTPNQFGQQFQIHAAEAVCCAIDLESSQNLLRIV
jgi:ADP-ribosylglycohydrolase